MPKQADPYDTLLEVLDMVARDIAVPPTGEKRMSTLGAIALARLAVLMLRREAQTPPPPELRSSSAEPAELPDIRPPAKRKRTGEITCPTCHAKPGDPCLILDKRGPHGKEIGDVMVTYHRARTGKAAEG